MMRDPIVNKFVELYKKHGNLTVVAGPGTGKTFISFQIILTIKNCKTILFCSPGVLLEKNLMDEVAKHNFPIENYDVEIATIKTAYKYVGKQYDLLVLDEAHACISDEYKNLLLNNTFNHIVFLTATPEDYKPEKAEIYKKYAPIYWRYFDSEKDGIVNKVRLIHFMYELNNDIKLTKKYRKNGKSLEFKVGELAQYEYLNKQVVKGRIMMANLGSEDFYSDSFKWLNKANAPSDEHYKAGFLYNTALRSRKKFLLNLESSKLYAKQVIDAILTNPNNKVLFFAEEIEYCKQINSNVYYADNPNKLALYESFMRGDIRCLGASKGLNVGLNMKGVNNLLFVNYVGSSTTGEQRLGRARRLPVDQQGTLIVFHPINTQYDSWYVNMMEKMTVTDVVHVDNMNDLIDEICKY